MWDEELDRCNSDNNDHMFQHMQGVCGASVVLQGWLVLGVMIGTGDVQTLKMPFQIILG